jgi:hypothetical protein
MGFLGMKDVKSPQQQQLYDYLYRCRGRCPQADLQYDPGKDSLKSALFDASSNVTVYFEYVNRGDNTYAAHYYKPGRRGLCGHAAYFD